VKKIINEHTVKDPVIWEHILNQRKNIHFLREKAERLEQQVRSLDLEHKRMKRLVAEKESR